MPFEPARLLEVADLTVQSWGLPPLDGVGLKAPAGSVTALIGPAGSGRSTLVAALTGEVAMRRGAIRLAGRELRRSGPERRRRAGLAWARSSQGLPPAASVFEAVALAQVLAQRPAWSWLQRPWAAAGEAGRREVLALLEKTGLDSFADHPVEGLPLAYRRRLQLALALAGRPRLLILDRPWVGLPRSERRRHVELLRALGEDGVAVLLVDDDLELVAELARHVVVLQRGQVAAQGTPAEIGDMSEIRRVFTGDEAWR